MTHEDAEIAVESGADGVVVSNHGARTMDHGQATIEVLPEVVKHLKSKKKTTEHRNLHRRRHQTRIRHTDRARTGCERMFDRPTPALGTGIRS